MKPPLVVSRAVRGLVGAARARAIRPQTERAPAIAVSPDVRLPDWPIYSLTWSIPQPTFGGMTNVLLHRARLFGAAGRPVDVLTFGYDFDVQRARRELRDTKKLSEGTRLRNLWEEVAAASDGQLQEASSHPKRAREGKPIELPDRLAATTISRRIKGDRIIPSVRGDLGNGLEQTDYYRDDGSLVLIDQRQAAREGARSRRTLTLVARDGSAVAQWGRPEDLYAFWLDLVIGKEKAYLICDSKFLGGLIHGYQRPNVVKVQCLHSAHLRSEAHSPLGLVTVPKKRLLANLENFDAHVVLTPQQAADMDALFGPSPSRFVVPNSVSTVSLPGLRRIDGRAVVVSRLATAKQIDHAIRAVGLHNDSHPGLPVQLEIYGSGEEESNLRHLTARLRLEDCVGFKGHTHTPEQAYACADFSLNTSLSEGFSLSPLESMAQGCIPISYDIKYGPASVITVGESGFLVEQGNVAELARQISRYLSLPRDEKGRMRRAAVAQAREFSEQRELQRWAQILTHLAAQHEDLGPARFRITAVDVRAKASGFHVEITGAAGRRLKAARASLRAVHRHQPAVLRFPCSLSSTRQGNWVFATSIAWEDLSWAPVGTFDFTLEISDAGDRAALRLPAPAGYQSQQLGRHSLYPTVYSNLSLKLGPMAG